MPELDDEERETIAQAMGWVASTFFQGNRQELLRWVEPYLCGAAREEMKKHLGLDDAVRIEAESRLVAFLKTAPTRPRIKRQMNSRISRNTDWVRSLMEHRTGRLHVYWNRNTVHVPDIPLLSALTGIARLWWQELEGMQQEGNNQYTDRLNALKNVCQSICFSPIAVGYDANMAASLRRYEDGDDLADLLGRVQGILWAPFKQEEDGKLLSDLFEKEDANTLTDGVSEGEKNNADTMLEVIATLAIASAFQTLGWTPKKKDALQGWKLRDGISLGKKGIRLDIRKGFPKSIKEKDRCITPLKHLGYTSTGKEPDIVMGFHSTEHDGKSIYIIGDAKRNAAGDGNSDVPYVRSAFFAMLGDFIAFGHAMNIELGKDQKDFFSGPIKPAGILFFKQMGQLQEDKDDGINDGIIVGLSYGEYAHCFGTESIKNGRFCKILKKVEEAVEKAVKKELSGPIPAA